MCVEKRVCRLGFCFVFIRSCVCLFVRSFYSDGKKQFHTGICKKGTSMSRNRFFWHKHRQPKYHHLHALAQCISISFHAYTSHIYTFIHVYYIHYHLFKIYFAPVRNALNFVSFLFQAKNMQFVETHVCLMLGMQ